MALLRFRQSRQVSHDVHRDLPVQGTQARHRFARVPVQNLVEHLLRIAHLFAESFLHVLGLETLGAVATDTDGIEVILALGGIALGFFSGVVDIFHHIDLPFGNEQRQILEKGIGKKVYIVSGATHEGLKEIHREIRAYIEGERERRVMEGREDEGFQP